MRKLLPFLAALVLLYGGCKNDIDLLAEYKNVIVCYGLLNPADSVQYIRISKVFLGEANALEMAQHEDTIGFPAGTLDVKMERWLNGQPVQTFSLWPDTTIPRDPGIFANPGQVLYKGNFPVLKDGSEYHLTVTDLRKGNSITSKTPIAQDPSLLEPGSFSGLNLQDTTYIRFRFLTGNHAKRYSLALRFHYTDQFIYDTTQVSEQYVDWQLGEATASRTLGNEQLQFAIRRNNFLNAMAVLIPAKPYTRRISGKVELIFTGSCDDLVTYIEVQNASASSAADLPPYSNIEGGYGLFSARTTTYFRNYWLDQDTRFALISGTTTASLNFVR